MSNQNIQPSETGTTNGCCAAPSSQAGLENCCRAGGPAARSEWTYRPDVDVLETAESFQVIADVPGVDPASVEIAFEDELLTIEAKAASRLPEGAAMLRQEYGVGAYHRRFRVGSDVDVDGIEATCADGVLTVTLPKSEQSKRRRIPVRAG